MRWLALVVVLMWGCSDDDTASDASVIPVDASGASPDTGMGSADAAAVDAAATDAPLPDANIPDAQPTDAAPPDGSGTLEPGEACADDTDCTTGVCWDFNDYDPFCFGSACSFACSNDPECVDKMTAAGAPVPGASSCGLDGKCETIGTGWGAYACASHIK